VRWSDDGHEGLVFPGPDATIEHSSTHRSSTERPASRPRP
jgi:hypothetical protein